MTVGDLRAALTEVPDAATIIVTDANGEPFDTLTRATLSIETDPWEVQLIILSHD